MTKTTVSNNQQEKVTHLEAGGGVVLGFVTTVCESPQLEGWPPPIVELASFVAVDMGSEITWAERNRLD